MLCTGSEPLLRHGMLIVHHLNNSRSQRVLWMLEELGVPYEVKHYQRNAKTMLAPPELRAVHPLGKSPVVQDGLLTVAESGAILEYLADTYAQGRLRPEPGSEDARRCTYWMHYAEGSAMPLLLLKLIFDQMQGKAIPWAVRPIAGAIAGRLKGLLVNHQLPQHMEHQELALTQAPWFSGSQFGIADIQMSYPVEAEKARGGLDARYPKLNDYLERIHARPTYARALERGGPMLPL